MAEGCAQVKGKKFKWSVYHNGQLINIIIMAKHIHQNFTIKAFKFEQLLYNRMLMFEERSTSEFIKASYSCD